MKIDEIVYKRNDDGTYRVTITQKRKDKSVTYDMPKVEIEWSSDNSIVLNTTGISVPQAVDMKLLHSDEDEKVLINCIIEEHEIREGRM